MQNAHVISSLDLVYFHIFQTSTNTVYRTTIQENKNNILEEIIQQIKPFQNSFLKTPLSSFTNLDFPEYPSSRFTKNIKGLGNSMTSSSIDLTDAENLISTKTCTNFYCTTLASDSDKTSIRQSGFYRVLLQIQEPLYILFKPKATFRFFFNDEEITEGNSVIVYKHVGSFGEFEENSDFKSQFEESFSETGAIKIHNDFDSTNTKEDIFYSIGTICVF